MCTLMSLMPLVMSLMIFLTPTNGGGGGDCAPGNFCLGGLRPPAQDTYL